MCERVDDGLLPCEIGVLGSIFEVEAVESLGATNLLPGKTMCLVDRPCKRRIGATDLRHVSLPAVLAVCPRDAKQPQPRARMPLKRGRLGEQQQRGVRHPPVACSVMDQPVVPKRLQDRPPADRSSCQKPLRQLQIEVVQRRVAAQALLEADPTVGSLALIDDFLRFPRHVVADPIRKAVPGNHDGFGSDWNVERQYFPTVPVMGRPRESSASAPRRRSDDSPVPVRSGAGCCPE